MKELIERLEKATWPSREIDGLIYGHLNGLKRNGGTFQVGDKFQFEHPTMRFPTGPAALYVPDDAVPEFTDSIDAALTLVPEGAGVLLDRYWISSVEHSVWSATISVGGVPDDPLCQYEMRDAPNAAIALCAAALKATSSAPSPVAKSAE